MVVRNWDRIGRRGLSARLSRPPRIGIYNSELINFCFWLVYSRRQTRQERDRLDDPPPHSRTLQVRPKFVLRCEVSQILRRCLDIGGGKAAAFTSVTADPIFQPGSCYRAK